MPELPEVETTLQGVAPYLRDQVVSRLVVRDRRLRWPVPPGIESKVAGQRIRFLERRGKYILIGLDRGGLLVHLGMSGSMRVLPERAAPSIHDHFDIETGAGVIIRYRDPRRFGCLLWHGSDIRQHKRLRKLGVEPLEANFNGEMLYHASRSRKVAVKNLIMNGEIVVGVGNIYASEALFDAAIHPHRRCDRIARLRYDRLAGSIRSVLARAINEGGTTLRDFVAADGTPGYFEQQLLVYGREDLPCPQCGTPVKRTVISQRATYYCGQCQR